jgi:hypothetical protein
MTHQLTLELPDEVYQPLVQKAQATGQTVAAVAQECLSQALTRKAGYGRLRRWAGALASGVPDAGVRHDEYLGQALYDELNEPRHD